MSNGVPNADAFKNIFRITAIIDVVYGLGFLLLPGMQFSMSQDPGVPANPGWVRWAGGILIGLGAGAWLASENPAKQRPMVVSLALGDGLAALALIYAVLSGEYQGVAWYIWAPVILTGGIAAAMCWLLNKFKAVL